ncbi:MAG: RloB domain-containing protein [Oscillospiraceae bacterium]|nr:RloB domain-containing protein [Oscillospiraceae bacterium]
MARQTRKTKPLIYVFCEGESEQAYTKFLKKHFADTAVIKCVPQTGLFQEAKDKFDKEAKYRDNADVTDEIWFFFDVEESDIGKWDQRLKVIKYLRRLKKKPGIRVRLLMTTACIEYWLLLHYEMTAPPIQTVADKARMLKKLQEYAPAYVKGDQTVTARIAQNYQTAIQHGTQTLDDLLADGLPDREDSDERNGWLCRSHKTFTTVQEAIQFLESCSK